MSFIPEGFWLNGNNSYRVSDMVTTTQRIKKFLAKYFPRSLTFAYRCLHAVRLGPYTISHADINDADLAEKLRQSIAKHTPTSCVRLEKTHLLLYTHGLPSGGAERQWCYLAVELARRGYAVTLLTDSLNGDSGHYLPLLRGSEVRVLAMDTLLIPAEVAVRIPPLNVPLCIYRCMAAFVLLRPSHVLCQLDGGNIFGGAAALFLEEGPKNLLFSFRNVNPSHFPHYYQPWMLTLYAALVESRDIILSGNSRYGNDDYADWLTIPRERVTTIHNALHAPNVKSDCREKLRKELGLARDSLVILSVFRMAPEKNPRLWLAVIRQLRDLFPQLVVLHAGVGDLTESITREAQRLGLENSVCFLGRRHDVYSLMQAADIFLLTSDFEGLPNVLLEAQVTGLPVVATRVGGVPEAVIEGETALLATKGDEQALVRHCRALLEDASLRERMGAAGKKNVATQFSHESMGDRTLDALGLPRAPHQSSGMNFEELPAQGMLASHAYYVHLITDYLSLCREPVIIFTGENSWERHVPTPQGSLCVAPDKAFCGKTSSSIIFDWAHALSWQPLRGAVTGQRIAFFSTNVCLNDIFRSRLRELGVQHIIFCDEGTIYNIPVIHPSLYKRLPLALRYIIKK